MNGHEHALKLLALARADLASLQGMLGPDESLTAFFTDEIYGFHAQHAVEKALKAWLAGLGLRYPHTHDIEALIELLEDRGKRVPNSNELADLAPYAVQFRFEAMAEPRDVMDYAAVLQRVRSIVDHIADGSAESGGRD